MLLEQIKEEIDFQEGDDSLILTFDYLGDFTEVLELVRKRNPHAQYPIPDSIPSPEQRRTQDAYKSERTERIAIVMGNSRLTEILEKNNLPRDVRNNIAYVIAELAKNADRQIDEGEKSSVEIYLGKKAIAVISQQDSHFLTPEQIRAYLSKNHVPSTTKYSPNLGVRVIQDRSHRIYISKKDRSIYAILNKK